MKMGVTIIAKKDVMKKPPTSFIYYPPQDAEPIHKDIEDFWWTDEDTGETHWVEGIKFEDKPRVYNDKWMDNILEKVEHGK